MNDSRANMHQDMPCAAPSIAQLCYASGNLIEPFRDAIAALVLRAEWDSSRFGSNPIIERMTILEMPLFVLANTLNKKNNYFVKKSRMEDFDKLKENIIYWIEKNTNALNLSDNSGGHYLYKDNYENLYNFIFTRFREGAGNLSYAYILAICDANPSPETSDLPIGQSTSILEPGLCKDQKRLSLRDDFSFYASKLHTSFGRHSFCDARLFEKAWAHSISTDLAPGYLPWEYRGRDISGITANRPGARVPTFTLSIDLRKSTSLMEQVEQPSAFAIWLESLSEICRDIVHHNKGIFDKFTGDGVIAHFSLTDEQNGDEASSRYDNAIDSPAICDQGANAFRCGCELVRAVQLHLNRLRPLLKFDIGTAGPSVGIAFDNASWSLDRDGRPIVVGKGVVNACRITGSPAGSIEVANNVKRFIAQMEGSDAFIPMIRLNNVQNHKDLKSEIEPRDWLCRIKPGEAADPFPGRPRHELQARVDTIFAEVEAMHQDRARLLDE